MNKLRIGSHKWLPQDPDEHHALQGRGVAIVCERCGDTKTSDNADSVCERSPLEERELLVLRELAKEVKR